jgi:hypothetical protein
MDTTNGIPQLSAEEIAKLIAERNALAKQCSEMKERAIVTKLAELVDSDPKMVVEQVTAMETIDLKDSAIKECLVVCARDPTKYAAIIDALLRDVPATPSIVRELVMAGIVGTTNSRKRRAPSAPGVPQAKRQRSDVTIEREEILAQFIRASMFPSTDGDAGTDVHITQAQMLGLVTMFVKTIDSDVSFPNVPALSRTLSTVTSTTPELAEACTNRGPSGKKAAFRFYGEWVQNALKCGGTVMVAAKLPRNASSAAISNAYAKYIGKVVNVFISSNLCASRSDKGGFTVSLTSSELLDKMTEVATNGAFRGKCPETPKQLDRIISAAGHDKLVKNANGMYVLHAKKDADHLEPKDEEDSDDKSAIVDDDEDIDDEADFSEKEADASSSSDDESSSDQFSDDDDDEDTRGSSLIDDEAMGGGTDEDEESEESEVPVPTAVVSGTAAKSSLSSLFE